MGVLTPKKGLRGGEPNPHPPHLFENSVELNKNKLKREGAIPPTVKTRGSPCTFFYELEKFKRHNIPPCIPPSPLDSAIMDYIVYGTNIAKENVLRLL